MRFYDRLEEYGSALAFLDAEGGAWTYQDLCRTADSFAARLGAPRLVFLEARNRFDSMAAYIGCLRGGHPVYLFGPQDEGALGALIATYRPSALVRCTDAGLEMEELDAPVLSFAADLRLLMSTSGSTGSAKFVKLSGRNIDANAVSIAQYLELDGYSRAITALKPNYSYGISIVNSHLAVGGSLALTDLSVTDAGFWPVFSQLKADSIAGVPYTYEMLDRQGVRLSDIAGLRYATQAGGKLAPGLVRKFAEDAKGAGRRFYVMYGQTEAAPRIAYLPPEQACEWPDCIGIPVPGGSIHLLDEAGAEIRVADTPGQLAYRGPNVMMGYAAAPDDLALDDTPDLLLSGDIAVVNAAGLFRIVGRTARFVKPFGIRINLDEVEQWITAQIAPAAVIGNDARIVVLLGEDSAADDGTPMARRIAQAFKLPAGVVECHAAGSIPKLSSGKTDYRSLNREYLPEVAQTAVPQTGKGILPLIFSKAFVRRSYDEALNILGLKKKSWNSVAELYAALLSVKEVAPDSTFSDLAGDSLTYVQATLALEEYLGRVPEGWEYMSVDDLEAANAAASL